MNDKYTFGNYAKKRWWVFLVLALLPLVAIFVFSVFLTRHSFNISDLGSMLGGTLAYLGTVLLGMTTIWQVERQRMENFEAMSSQSFDEKKGIVSFSVEVIFNHVVLIVKNIGNSAIENGKFVLDEEWITKFENYDEYKTKPLLLKSLLNGVYLAPDQEIRFFLHEIGTNHERYVFLTENECTCKVDYFTLGKEVKEERIISFHSVLHSFYGLVSPELAINKMEKMIKDLVVAIKDLKQPK